jgi:hypothetical protein
MTETEDERRQEDTPEDIASFWQVQLALADRDQQDWVKEAKTVVQRYRAEQASASKRNEAKKFNILFSNTEVLKAALYGKAAKPDVRRRFADKDPTARMAADVIERALVTAAEAYDVDKCIGPALHDHLLPGRGTVRVEYTPVFGERPQVDPMTGQPFLDEEGQPVMERFIQDQIVRERYVYWEDYRQQPARSWEGVGWQAFRHLFTREDLEDLIENKPQGSQTFADPALVPLNWEPDTGDKKKIPEHFKKCEAWEIWDKAKKQRVWIVKGYDKPLRVDEDPYGLQEFFSAPEPLRSIEDTETLVPTPEFLEYRDQADDLDEVTGRISRLTRALKRRGVYNKTVEELRRLARAGDNEFIPVDNYTALMEKGGLAAQFQTEDIQPISVVLRELYVQRDQLIQGIYEITGIADVMRGASDPNETLGAQKLKAQFGSTRLKKRQRAVQKWIRDIYKLKAEIMAEHFEPDVLSQMTGQEVPQEVVDLLRSDKLRSYRIDVETDSTVFEDAEADKAATNEMLMAVAGFLEKGMPVVQQVPQMGPLVFEMISIGVRSFKEGRKIEDILEQTAEQLAQAQQQKEQNPEPDPEAEKAKVEMEGKQMDHQMAQESHQMDMQKKQVDLQTTQAKSQAELQKLAIQQQMFGGFVQ